MATKLVKNTFTKGMQKDLDKSLQPNNTYIHAENFRLVPNKDSTAGALETVLGNTNIVDIFSDNGEYPIGYTMLRDLLIVFATTNNITGDYSGYSRIYKIVLAADTAVTPTVLYTDELNSVGNKLNFHTDHKIKAIGRYENSLVQKIYWTDNYNNLRFANIIDDGYYVLQNLTVDKFDLLPNTFFGNITLDKILPGGNMLTGMTQYAFKFYNEHGSETTYSQLSSLYSVENSNNSAANDSKIKGEKEGTVCNKSFKIKLKFSAPINNFNRIEVIAIDYNNFNSVPTVRIIADQDIFLNQTEEYIIDAGQSLGTKTIAEVNLISTSVFKCKDIETKFNYLFAGNITEETFDVDWDARAYRFGISSTSTKTCRIYGKATKTVTGVQKGVTETYITFNSTLVGSTYSLTGAETAEERTVFTNQLVETYTVATIPTYYDCLNKYNTQTKYDRDVDIQDSTLFAGPVYDNLSYVYQKNGTVMGGTGVNVEYQFIQEQFSMADNVETATGRLQYVATEHGGDTGSIRNFSSPEMVGESRGFVRDEIYRLGIVFINDKGQDSFVKWIGDIRMPKMSHYEILANAPALGNYVTAGPALLTLGITSYGSTVTNVKGYNLQLQINLFNLPTSTCAGYKIVFAERTEADKTVVSNGIINMCQADPGISAFNLRRYTTSSGKHALATFHSPEISVNKSIKYASGDYFDVEFANAFYPSHFKDILNSPYFPVNVYSDSGLWLAAVNGATHNLPLKLSIKQSIFVAQENFITAGVPGTYTNIATQAWPFTNARTSDVAATDGWLSPGGSCLLFSIGDIYYGQLPKATGGPNTWYDFTGDGYDNANTLYGRYKRLNATSIYGGDTYNNRQNCKYIAACDFKPITSPLAVICGDSYVTTFDHLYSIYDYNLGVPNKRHATFIYFPVETQINTNLFDQLSFKKTAGVDTSTAVAPYSGTITNGSYTMTEYAGQHQIDAGIAATNFFVQKDDLYSYNKVYSKVNDTQYYYPRPELFNDIQTHDTMVRYSNNKINGEDVDNWTKFESANYIEVDSKYGELTNIVHYKNKLLFWQPKAFGLLAVNDRSISTDNSGQDIVLGSGGVLARFDYVSTITGNQFFWGIAQGDNGLYWFDAYTNELWQFAGQDISLSKVNGVQSHLFKLENITNVIAATDNKFDEILFTISYSNDDKRRFSVEQVVNAGFVEFLILNVVDGNITEGDTITDSTQPTIWSSNRTIQRSSGAGTASNRTAAYYIKSSNQIYVYFNSGTNLSSTYSIGDIITVNYTHGKETLVFNERINGFTGFYTFTPELYMITNNYYLSVENYTNFPDIYIHNYGDYGTFYNSGIADPSKVMYLVNPEYNYTKVFDSVQYFSSAVDSNGINQYGDTFDEFRMYNDYQNTNYITIDTNDKSSIVRRERNWSLQVPRNSLDINIISNPDIFDPNNLSTETRQYRERIKDKYMNVEFTYLNADNYKFNVPYFITSYRTSIR